MDTPGEGSANSLKTTDEKASGVSQEQSPKFEHLTAYAPSANPHAVVIERQERLPASEEVKEVAPGVLRMQLPISLPGLAHVNCYAIEDGEGFAIVDPGLPGDEAWAELVRKLKIAGIPETRIHTVLITHSHPDHFGNAGKLAEVTNSDVITHSAFQLMHRPFHVCHEQDCSDPDHARADVGQEPLPEGDKLLSFGMRTPWGRTVWDPRAQEQTVRESDAARQIADQMFMLKPTQRVKNDQSIMLGGRNWFAVHTPGHTLDHLCLWEPESGTLISGDHILPTITPHISGLSTGRDPLGNFMSSLDKCAQLPGVKMALPAHGGVVNDVPLRAEEIKEHHAERLRVLARVSQAVGETTVEEFSHYLFRKERWGSMAESETYAHLIHLVAIGSATQRVDAEGIPFFTVT